MSRIFVKFAKFCKKKSTEGSSAEKFTLQTQVNSYTKSELHCTQQILVLKHQTIILGILEYHNDKIEALM